jgi:hypothetical protein
MAAYIGAHIQRSGAPYDRNTAPGGYVGLCIAENALMCGELAERLANATALPSHALGYDSMIGALAFRERLARFLGRRILQRPVAP